ncbi:hypothetical protein BT96DRAFT_874188 [Gymnopus androsaceus JB14]|uniref:Uncharacterized protein n=1 Tax=Gymnopus androsaceus JB14 TaxID=1447944 RepID=A0A6A4IDC9_9AGAR|nr:hypothetical protein BT96DRAFT_874188 [Gymnopus androsaceus JB14]
MRFFNILAFCSVLPLLAFACEGDCITNTTKEFIEKYKTPMDEVLNRTNRQINAKFQLPDSTNCVAPLADDYNKTVYSILETAIFPNYFHGKCQQPDGKGGFADPPGCPNPDCPVVCGTPGSLCHFYSTLISIVFKTHQGIYTNLTMPGAPAREKVRSCIQNAIQRCSKSPRDGVSTSRPFSRLFAARFPLVYREEAKSRRNSGSCYTQGPDAVDKDLSDIFDGIPNIWSEVCDEENHLEGCSWEGYMKPFILSFP